MNGLIIEESLTDKDALIAVEITKTESWQANNAAAYQPHTWTALSFSVDDEKADQATETLKNALKRGWYVNASTGLHVYVIFPDRIFKYVKGDKAVRKNAKEYGRSQGIPESQLDWSE
jgi:hypothetical protein